MASHSPTAIFDIPELAELILIQDITTKDLVNTLRICRSINGVIHGSKKLKQKLFLQPLPFEPVSPYTLKWRSASMHPLTTTYASRIPVRKHLPYHGDLDKPLKEVKYGVVSLNPIFNRTIYGGPNPSLPSFFMEATEANCGLPTLVQILQRGPCWNEMFVCQPPASKIESRYRIKLCRKGCLPVGGETVIDTIVCKEGIRLGDVVTRVRAAVSTILEGSN